MARQRRAKVSGGQVSCSPHPQGDLCQLDDRVGSRHSRKTGSRWCPALLYGTGASLVVLAVIYFLYVGYMETRINTAFPAPKVVGEAGLEVSDRYWGTYRPGLYFGTRTRHPTSPVTGLMWFVPGHFQNNMLALRHWCDQGDDLHSYGWTLHDGRHVGQQSIVDKHIKLDTKFVKRPGGLHGGDWTARITALPKSKQETGSVASLLYYVALDPDDQDAVLWPNLGIRGAVGAVEGAAASLGGFKLSLLNSSGIVLHRHHLSTTHLGLHQLKETVFRGLTVVQGQKEGDKHIGLVGDLFSHQDLNRRPNFVALQVIGQLPFEVEVVYESDSLKDRPSRLAAELFSQQFNEYAEKFHADFEAKFSLEAKGFKKQDVDFAKAALSNMLGGIGYFYGTSRVQGDYNKDPVPYWKAELYSAVPSRSFFPRGFLWDEGFHNLLIAQWDREISQDILAHWFDLMNWDGWIPREQILGVEARARVPDEFVVQRSTVANPPTLLLPLHYLLSSLKQDISDHDYQYLSRLWPRLKAWFTWFNTTQAGTLPGTYRWRGRDPRTTRELNPKTLASGLDDYPRASHPTTAERHLDLRCWMTLAAGLLADLATIVEKDPTRYLESFRFLQDNSLLDALHWSYATNSYMDYGLHTDKLHLKRLTPNAEPQRVTLAEPKLGFVDSFGYVSFFPLFLQLLDPDSAKLGRVLEDLRRPDLLWTEYGLRSLAKNAPLYNERNTEHDPPYWRGSIWLNMNFLAVRALHHYAHTPGPHHQLAGEVYTSLRHNLIANLLREYRRTGHLWEHYNDRTGRGQGSRPFTGWTALVVLIMAEAF